MKYLLFLSLLMLGCYSKNDTTDKTGLSGKVIKIVDGDTYDLLLDNLTTKRIRMEGIDAPEKGMPFYQAAKNNLGKLCFGQVVKIEQTNTDKYGRAIAKTYLANGNELGLLMVEAGFAKATNNPDFKPEKAKIEKKVMKLKSNDGKSKVKFDNSEYIKSFQSSDNKE